MELCPQFTAVILILAAGSAQFAVITGGDQADDVIQRMPDARPLIRDHAEWGENMRTVAVIAAIVALVALAFYRVRGFRRILALITAVAGVAACYCAVQAAQRGGAMVYHHGVGVQIKPIGANSQSWSRRGDNTCIFSRGNSRRIGLRAGCAVHFFGLDRGRLSLFGRI